MKAFERFFSLLKKAYKPDITNWYDFDFLYIEKKKPTGTFLYSKEILILNCAHKFSETAYKAYTAASGQADKTKQSYWRVNHH